MKSGTAGPLVKFQEVSFLLVVAGLRVSYIVRDVRVYFMTRLFSYLMTFITTQCLFLELFVIAMLLLWFILASFFLLLQLNIPTPYWKTNNDLDSVFYVLDVSCV